MRKTTLIAEIEENSRLSEPGQLPLIVNIQIMPEGKLINSYSVQVSASMVSATLKAYIEVWRWTLNR